MCYVVVVVFHFSSQFLFYLCVCVCFFSVSYHVNILICMWFKFAYKIMLLPSIHTLLLMCEDNVLHTSLCLFVLSSFLRLCFLCYYFIAIVCHFLKINYHFKCASHFRNKVYKHTHRKCTIKIHIFGFVWCFLSNERKKNVNFHCVFACMKWTEIWWLFLMHKTNMFYYFKLSVRVQCSISLIFFFCFIFTFSVEQSCWLLAYHFNVHFTFVCSYSLNFVYIQMFSLVFRFFFLFSYRNICIHMSYSISLDVGCSG